MDKIKIEGVPPWDGDWDFDASTVTNRELNRIKVITALDGAPGIIGSRLLEALAVADTGLMVAMAVVALARHGKTADPDDFWDATAGSINYVGEADDDGPPAEGSQSESNEPDSSDSN